MSHLTGRAIADHSSREPASPGDNHALDDTPDTARPPSSLRPAFAGATPLGIFSGVASAALCVAASSKTPDFTFTPKYFVVLLIAAVGVVPLVLLARRSSPTGWAARGACAFLVVALISALASPSPNIGLFGLYAWGTGWLLWLAAAGAFAIAASLGPIDRAWLFGGLLVGVTVNALVGVWQVLANPSTPGLALYDGTQADGLLGNPIHLEALMLGGLALVLGRVCRDPLRWGWLALLYAVALEFTAERLALPVLVALVVYALITYKLKKGGVYGLIVLVGYGIGYLGGGSSLGSRVTSATGENTFGLRARVWQAGLDYLGHHPVIGVGPGQLRTAIDSVMTLSLAQRISPSRVLTDGHDIIIEVAVTTGLVGLACFLAWLAGAFRGSARCAFLGFAVAMLLVDLVEPLNITILPLEFFGLGAAMAVRAWPPDPDPSAEPARTGAFGTGRVRPFALGVLAVATVAAVFLGATMVAGDIALYSSTHFEVGHPFDLSEAKRANTLLPYWPESAENVQEVVLYQSFYDGSPTRAGIQRGRHWISVAISRDHRDPQLWVDLGDADLELQSYSFAEQAYQQSLAYNRWYAPAFGGLGDVATHRRDWAQAVGWYHLAVLSSTGDPAVSESLKTQYETALRHLAASRGR